MYLEEKEVLLQSGLVGKIEGYSILEDGRLTIFNVFISDSMIEKEKRKRGINLAVPFLLFTAC